MRSVEAPEVGTKRAGAASALMIALLAAMVVQGAGIFDIWVPGVSRVAMAVEAGVIAFYLLRCFVTGRIETMAAGLAVFGLLLGETVWFAVISRTAPNFNIVFAFLPLIVFVPFIAYENSFDDLLHLFLALIAVYLLVYVTTQGMILQAAAASSRAVLSGDADRGDRVYLALPLASFLAFYALKAIRLQPLLRLGLIILSFTALWLSGSRTFQFLFLLVFLLAMVGLMNRLTRIVLFGAFAVVTIVLMGGFVWPEWNPFAFMSWDSSAAARAAEYRVAVQATYAHWITGIGLAGNDADMQHYLHTPRYEPLFPADIGALGPLVLFGVPGLIAFVGIVWFCMAADTPQSGSGAMRGLRLNGVLCGLYGVISPTLMLESNAVFLSLLIALRVRLAARGRTMNLGLYGTDAAGTRLVLGDVEA